MQNLEIKKLKSSKAQFYLFLSHAVLSWILPDALPFIDEVFLAYLAYFKFKEAF